MVIRDDPRYYPYRYGGRNVIADRLAHPGPRYVFLDAGPATPRGDRAPRAARGKEDDAGTHERRHRRTRVGAGAQGPGAAVGRGRCRARVSPVRPLLDERRRVGTAGARPSRRGPARATTARATCPRACARRLRSPGARESPSCAAGAPERAHPAIIRRRSFAGVLHQDRPHMRRSSSPASSS